jgi:hypothetical protein
MSYPTPEDIAHEIASEQESQRYRDALFRREDIETWEDWNEYLTSKYHKAREGNYE